MQRTASIGGAAAAIAALVALAACSVKSGAESPPDVNNTTASAAPTEADKDAAGASPPEADQGTAGAAPSADPMNGIPASGLSPDDKTPSSGSPTRN
jgi:predicted small lipoprotein YifL